MRLTSFFQIFELPVEQMLELFSFKEKLQEADVILLGRYGQLLPEM